MQLLTVLATDGPRWLQWTGIWNEAGPWYGLWSGFGGANWTILGVAFIWYFHRTCHAAPWWHLRIGHPVDGTPYLLCAAHHPDHHGKRRSVDLVHILEARRKANEAPPTKGSTP